MLVAYAANSVEKNNFAQILKLFQNGTVIAENLKEIKIEDYQREMVEELLNNYSKGRIFASEHELLWEKDQEEYHFRYIGEKENQVASLFGFEDKDKNVNWLKLDEKKSNKRLYYLWGERGAEAEEWFEPRIAQNLCYRATQGKASSKMCLQIIEYYDEDINELTITRFLEFKGERN